MKNLLQQGIRYAKLKLGALSSQQKMDYQSALAYLALPKVLPFSEESLARCSAGVNQKFGMEDFVTHIHKNDMMFHYRLYNHCGYLDQALRGYYMVGADIVHKLHKIAEQHDLETKHILDFGCGYGRVSRFWPHFFPTAEISVSDIKRTALAFQAKNFGFKTIVHTADPSSFSPTDQFQLILALSVFTHLPQNLFTNWLWRLANVLSPGGALIFTYNDTSSNANKKLLGKKRREDFVYLPNSEEVLFPFIADSNTNLEEYGHAFISKDLLKREADNRGMDIHFLGNKLAKNQEAALLLLNN